MSPTPPTDRWIGDHRSTGPSGWPAGLREALVAAKRRALRRMFKWIAIALAVVVVAIVAAISIDSFIRQPHSDTALIALVFAAAICLIPTTLFVADALKQRGIIARALCYPQLERFALAPHVRDDVAAAQALGIDASLEGVPTALFIVPAPLVHPPAPSLLLQIDSEPLSTPQQVFVSSLPRLSAAPAAPTSPAAGMQPLEPGELDELRRYVADGKRATRRFVAVYMFLTIMIAITACFLALGVMTPRSNVVLVYVVPALWLFLTWCAVGPGRRRRRMLKLFRLDLRDGRTIVLEGHAAVADLRSAGMLDPREPVVNPGVVRLLPHSRLWWEIDGVPAAWRR